MGFASQVRFHGKRYPWFVSDVTKKDWEWLLNSMVYGHLFPDVTEIERESLKSLGERWKVRRYKVARALGLTAFFSRSTSATVPGSTSSTLIGAPATRSGICTAKHLICSSTSASPIWSSSRVILTTAR